MTPLTIGGRTIRPPGQRIFKTTLAVFFCMLYGSLRNTDSSIFFAAVAAVFALRPDLKTTWASVLDRLVGTMVGALLGLLALELQIYFQLPPRSLPYYLIVTAATFINLWAVANVFRPGGMIVSNVVLFSIAISHGAETSAVSYAAFRVLDTGVGLFLALLINVVWPPKQTPDEVAVSSSEQDTV